MTGPSMAVLVRKEARALWLVWGAAAAACAAVAVAGQPRFTTPGQLAYFVGSIALAAASVGHEYTHGTLPVLLTQPVDRRRLIAAKVLATLPMLGSLALLALAIGPGGPYFERGTIIGALSLVAAVSLAPWLTMVSRSPLAGAVFAMGIAGMTHIVSLGLLITWLELGGRATRLQTVGDRLLVACLVVVSLIGLVASWRTFMTVEAIERQDAQLAWPRWLRSAMVMTEEELVLPPRRSHPLWLLVKKELRIQQMSIAVAGINVMIWVATYALVEPSPETANIMAVVAVLYGGLLAILIGAIASAEERHLGTLEWQTLLPVAAWRQFAVKTAVALTLSLVLAFALPIVLARGELAVTPAHAATVVLLTIGSLLVSSRCDSGLQALAMAAPALFVVAVMLGWSWSLAPASGDAALATIGGLAVLALWLAFVNHRTARS